MVMCQRVSQAMTMITPEVAMAIDVLMVGE
jgi:hypothetical protein